MPHGDPAACAGAGAQVREQKPCYINICCNVAGLPHPSFATIPVPFSISPRHTNEVRARERLAVHSLCP